MAFSTRDARRQSMSAELRDWCDGAGSEERRTLIFRLATTADVAAVTAGLRDVGAEIVSAGSEAVIANVRQADARRACRVPGVLRIDAPSRMKPSFGR